MDRIGASVAVLKVVVVNAGLAEATVSPNKPLRCGRRPARGGAAGKGDAVPDADRLISGATVLAYGQGFGCRLWLLDAWHVDDRFGQAAFDDVGYQFGHLKQRVIGRCSSWHKVINPFNRAGKIARIDESITKGRERQAVINDIQVLQNWGKCDISRIDRPGECHKLRQLEGWRIGVNY